MIKSEVGSPTERIADLLTRERDAILSGRLDRLERIASEKDRLGREIAYSDIHGSQIAGLRELAERNARLLEAMRLGLRDAIRRISASSPAREAFQTYDSSGRRKSIGADPTLKESW